MTMPIMASKLSKLWFYVALSIGLYLLIVFSPYSGFLLSTNTTYCHDITEILLKVALNPINQPNQPYCLLVRSMVLYCNYLLHFQSGLWFYVAFTFLIAISDCLFRHTYIVCYLSGMCFHGAISLMAVTTCTFSYWMVILLFCVATIYILHQYYHSMPFCRRSML